MYDNKKPTTVGGIPTGDMTESGNPTHNPDGTFGNEESVENKYGFDFDGYDTFDFLNNLNLDGAEEFDFLDDIDLNEQLETAIDRDYNSHLALKLGKEHYDKIIDLVSQCGNKNVIKFWKKYLNSIAIMDCSYKGRAHASGVGIYFNIENDSKGGSYLAPYEVFFHESGHAIDHFAKNIDSQNMGSIGFKFSVNYKNGLFPKTIQNEINGMVLKKQSDMKEQLNEAIKDKDWIWFFDNGFISSSQLDKAFSGIEPDFGKIKISKERAYKKLAEEISKNTSFLERANLSDIFEGATYGKIDMGVGHGSTYWRNGTFFGVNHLLATEAFTEMFSSIITHKESINTIKKYLPKSYAVFEEMLEEMIK